LELLKAERQQQKKIEVPHAPLLPNSGNLVRCMPIQFVAHGKPVQRIAAGFGWRPGARYTNLRDVKHVAFHKLGFLDIHWKEYSFRQHLAAAELTKPHLTVARDIENIDCLEKILVEAEELRKHASYVVVVPKDAKLTKLLESAIPPHFLLGYSCPTRYGKTPIPPEMFQRPVHLLGGRPDIQRSLANIMPVYSFDCNRFTIDASYGDYFDGIRFRPLGEHNYYECIRRSLTGINAIWADYEAAKL